MPKKILWLFLKLALVVTTSGSAVAKDESFDSQNESKCALKQRQNPTSPHNAFNIEDQRAIKSNVFSILVVPIQFVDLRQSNQFVESFEKVSQSVEQFYSRMSRKGPSFDWRIISESLVLSGTVKSYDAGSRSKIRNVVSIVREAQDVMHKEISIQEFDLIVLVTPPATRIKDVATSISVLDDMSYKDSAILSGDFWQGGGRWEVLAHELGHALGLLDLYSTGSSNAENRTDAGFFSQFGFMGPYDLMNWPTGPGPELTAWNRFMLGFLKDIEIKCIPKGISQTHLEAIQEFSGTRAIFIKLDESRLIVIENRQRIGFDRGLSKNSVGLIVYEVNLLVQSGFGPLRLLSRSRDSRSHRYAISTGQSIEYAGFKISSVSQHGSKLLVEIRKLTFKSNSNQS